MTSSTVMPRGAIFLANVVISLRRSTPAPADPWGADTLEWMASWPPADYNFAELPTVRTLYPMWDERAHGAAPCVVGLRTDRREVLVTHVLDAQPGYRSVLPQPSFVPLLLASSTTVAFLGVLYSEWMVPIGAALSLAAVIKWNWPGTAERTPPWRRHRDEEAGRP